MKKILATILAGMSLTMMSSAFAAEPITLGGDVSVKYDKDTSSGESSSSGSLYTLKLKGEAELGNGWGAYARLGAQYATQPELADYNIDSSYDSDRKSVIALDQFGLTYKKKNLVYKLGRQDIAVGRTALLYSRADSNIGKNSFVDGLTISGTMGIIDLAGAVVREDNTGAEDNKIYAIRTGVNSSANLDWGLTLASYRDSVNASTNHWAVDSTYKFGKSSVTGEYTASSSNTDNAAYAATWNYEGDDRTAVYVTSFRVEANGDMGKQSDFDNDNKGIYYGVTHKLSEVDSMEVVFKDQRYISTGQKNTKLEATVTHSF
ncbi:MAG: hypothetical protein H6Q69_401 [Firmicutes bacterium]|nr:hypothetical protein [Bacillota bacterium]